LYDALSIILLFPLIVFLGANGAVEGRLSSRVCKFLGDISYPIYITHYPLIYIYTAWVHNHKVTLAAAFPIGVVVLLLCIALAYAALKLYDEPIRGWLQRKLVPAGKHPQPA
jgi:peptidoglycan/LPS O-acetylase OafA/YrhL